MRLFLQMPISYVLSDRLPILLLKSPSHLRHMPCRLPPRRPRYARLLPLISRAEADSTLRHSDALCRAASDRC